MTSIQISEHRIVQAVYHQSPHQSPLESTLPNSDAMSLIVIHSMSLPYGEYGNDYIKQLFLGTLDCSGDSSAHPSFKSLQGLKVSAHLVIRRDGSIMQFGPFDRKAWHAGKSSYQGREKCNDFSIGIEMEGSKEDDYEELQYEVLVKVCQELLATYTGLDFSRIVGHSDIAPGRKTDPWNFNWEKFYGTFKKA
ncbi:MAG: 1,6-anhydro-N-acetylmuramyl-L-alanine amidase AmpD [Gammaproteobacteria bacterium]|nr:1,6-anhydro-N-acetylmuramyl-L-alanine amidase AmpD [Gammaproteobacteria bacterium]